MYADEFKSLLNQQLLRLNKPNKEQWLSVLEQLNRSLPYTTLLSPELYLQKVMIFSKSSDDYCLIRNLAKDQFEQLHSFDGWKEKNVCIELKELGPLTNHLYKTAKEYADFLKNQNKCSVIIMSELFTSLSERQLINMSINNDYIILTIRTWHSFNELKGRLLPLMADHAFLVLIIENIDDCTLVKHFNYLFDFLIYIHDGAVKIKTNLNSYNLRY